MINKDIAPESVKENILTKMPENLQNAFERVTVAGMKLFYSKEIQSQLMDDSEKSGQNLATEIGVSATGMISMLQQRSNGTIPPQVMIPAGIYLIAEAADFMDKTGKFPELNDAVIGDAIEIFIVSLLQKNGIDAEQAQQLAKQMADQVEGGGGVDAQAMPAAAPTNSGGLLQQGAR